MNLVEAATGEIIGEVGERSIILADGKFRFTALGLTVEGQPTFEEWEAVGDLLGHIQKRIHWWIGDWLAYGERRWGEDHAQDIDTERFSPKTLANDKWVASRVDSSLRKEELSFTHHALVAPLEPAQQAALLDRAVEESMTTADLHREVKRVQAEAKNGTLKVEITIAASFLVREDALAGFREEARTWGGEMAARDGVSCIEFRVERK